MTVPLLVGGADPFLRRDFMLLAIAKSLVSNEANDTEEADCCPVAEMSDQQLMVSYADGNIEAFEALVSRHEKPLFNFILRSCGKRARAEEILQEVFMRVIKYSDTYEPTAKFTTWVYTIARNLCIDKARKRNTRGTEMSLDQRREGGDDRGSLGQQLADDAATSAPVDYDRAVFRQKLDEALDALPDKQREVFMLREFSGLKYREIADAVDCKAPTVKSRMRYALEALRSHLADYLDHSFDREESREIAATNQ